MPALEAPPLSDALLGCLWCPPPFICFGESVSCDSFLVRKFSLSAPIPRLTFSSLSPRRFSAYLSHAYQLIPTEFRLSPSTFVNPQDTENANRPATPCTTLFVLPTTEVVSASLSCVQR